MVLPALRQGAKIIFISTDKAVDPISVMGMSKAMAERIVYSHREFIVRFSNVLNSRGSLLETWTLQRQKNQPLTITNFQATRMLMTIEEAASLILTVADAPQAGVYAPHSLTPITIESVYRWFDDKAPFTVTALRPGEKLHEVMWWTQERPKPYNDFVSVCD